MDMVGHTLTAWPCLWQVHCWTLFVRLSIRWALWTEQDKRGENKVWTPSLASQDGGLLAGGSPGLGIHSGDIFLSTELGVSASDCPMASWYLLCDSNRISSWLKTLGILILNYESFLKMRRLAFRHFILISHFVVQGKSYRNYSNLKPNQVKIDWWAKHVNCLNTVLEIRPLASSPCHICSSYPFLCQSSLPQLINVMEKMKLIGFPPGKWSKMQLHSSLESILSLDPGWVLSHPLGMLWWHCSVLFAETNSKITGCPIWKGKDGAKGWQLLSRIF